MGAFISILWPTKTPSTTPTPRKLELLDLPTEILDLILQHTLTFPHAIEFAPLTISSDFITGRLTSLRNHPASKTYVATVRPGLRVLRTCRLFHALCSRIYYTHNRFRFSGRFGWYVLPRWLHLIGPANRAWVRDLSIVHPAQAYTLRSLELGFLSNTQLKPFGLSDLKTLHRVYCFSDSTRRLRCQEDPLETLRSMTSLRTLRFLFYPTLDSHPNCASARSQPDFVRLGGMNALLKIEHWMACAAGWEGHGKLRRVLVNLFARGEEVVKMVGGEEEIRWSRGLIAEVWRMGGQMEGGGVGGCGCGVWGVGCSLDFACAGGEVEGMVLVESQALRVAV